LQGKKKNISSGAKTSEAVRSVCCKMSSSVELVHNMKKRALESLQLADAKVVEQSGCIVRTTGLETEDDILKSYGLNPSSSSNSRLKLAAEIDLEVHEVMSSQEPTLPAKTWLDSAARCMKRQKGSTIETARMVPGDEDFAMAIFDNEAPVRTEMPNILLKAFPVVMKKPAGRKKKKAAVKHPADSDEDHDDDEEDEEEHPAPRVVKRPARAVDPAAGEGLPPAVGGEPPSAADVDHGPVHWQKQNFKFEASVWGSCKAEFYTHKSYIRHQTSEGSWRLVIQTEKKDHHKILKSLVDHVKRGLSKEELKAVRATLEDEE